MGNCSYLFGLGTEKSRYARSLTRPSNARAEDYQEHGREIQKFAEFEIASELMVSLWYGRVCFMSIDVVHILRPFLRRPITRTNAT